MSKKVVTKKNYVQALIVCCFFACLLVLGSLAFLLTKMAITL